MFRHQAHRYSRVTIALHWLTLLVIVGAYVFIQLHEAFPKGSEARALMKTRHFTLGLLVLPLLLGRLVAYFTGGRAPAIEPPPPRWTSGLRLGMHWALYAFLLAMPLLGWAALSAGGKQLPFGLPALLSPHEDLYRTLKRAHETLGQLGLPLIGLHAAASLIHHYAWRDDALRRMLPGRRREPDAP